MKNILIIAVIVMGLYYFYPTEHSAESIAKGINFDGYVLSYDGEDFYSEWTSSNEVVKGRVRLIESTYNKTMPVITTALIITTGDYSDPELIRIDKSNNGYLFYQLNPSQKPKGTVIIYHMIPSNVRVQNRLSSVKAGDSISLLAKISTSGELKGERAILKFAAYKPNEFVPTKMVAEHNSIMQLILFVEGVND